MRHFLLILFLFGGCSERYVLDSGIPDAGADGDCDCLLIGDYCDAEGHCLCGGDPSCLENEECRHGICVPQDETGRVCEFDDQCLTSARLCVRGRCSLIPDECTGGYFDPAAPPLSRYCWDNLTPAPDAVVFPPCRRGAQICFDGEWSECLGAIMPVPEIGVLACTPINEDCDDGCINGTFVDGVCTPTNTSNFDVVFAIDVSGSMQTTIDAVKTASNSLSMIYSTPNFRFALVTFPLGSSRPLINSDFVSFTEFSALLSTVSANSGSGLECSYDTVWELGTELLELSWLPISNRIIILFTDEPAQTYRMPNISESDVCSSLRHGEVVAIVTYPMYYEMWDECPLNLRLFQLSTDVESMVTNLQTIIRNPCEGM